MMKGMLQAAHLSSDGIAIEAIVGVSDPRHTKLDWHPLLDVPLVPVLRNLKSVDGFETTIKSYSKFVNKVGSADIIFYNSPPIDVITFTYPFIARLAGKKQIYYLHGSLVNEKVNSLGREYFHLIANRGLLNEVIIPLESSTNLVAKLLCPYKIITTIPECVVTPWYEGSHKIPLEGDPVILYAGRLVQVKRVDILLKAFSTVESYFPSARLYLAGSGPLELDLRKLCTKLGISDKVLFLGHVQHDRLRVLYRSSDMFVLPSEAEFMSLSLLEAMASRCAVIASDVAAIEVVKDGQSGLVFPRGDVKMLADNISSFADDKTLRKKLSEAAYLTVKEKFDYRVVGSKLVQEMHNILI